MHVHVACSMHTIVLGRDGQLPGFLLAPPRTAGRLRLELVELAMTRRLSEAMLRQLQQQLDAAAVEGEKKGPPQSQAKTAGAKRAEEKLEKQARYLVITPAIVSIAAPRRSSRSRWANPMPDPDPNQVVALQHRIQMVEVGMALV